MRVLLSGKKNSKGFATVEVLVAFAIVLLFIGAAILITFGNQSVAVDSQINSEAIYKAKKILEEARATARFDFSALAPTNTTETSGLLSFIKKLELRPVDIFTLQATSTVTWFSGGRTLSVFFTTLLTNPDAVSGGNTCSSILSGDWTNPQKTEYEFGDDILNDTSSGFPITSIQTFNKKMYVTVSNDNGNNDETFFILDLTDNILSPADVLGKLDNSLGTISEGLNAVAVDGENYAYVANAYDSSPQNCPENHNCAQLQVINVSNPNNPTLERNFKINSFTSGNKLANATSVFYKNKIVYLGLANANNGKEFFVIDVGGSGGGTPANPIILSSVEIGNGVNSIVVKDNYAYVASPNLEELMIFNISNPSNPTPAGNFNSGAGAGNGKSLYLVGNKLYLGKTVPNAGNDFHILNNINPNSSLAELGGLNSSDSITGIIVRDFLAFTITSGGKFQTWKIDQPTNITQYALPLTLPPGSGGGLQGTASDCEGNYIFVGSKSSNDKGYISIITAN